LGVIGAPHGVRGAMKVRTFTKSPQDIAAYGPLTDTLGERVFVFTSCKADKGNAESARVTLKGVDDRDGAVALRGVELYVARAQLPQLTQEDDFYYADLIGLQAVGLDGVVLGEVTACHNFGAGDLLEINGAFYPFTKQVVPQVDVAAGQLTLVPPLEQEALPDEEGASE
jgi:16S rRNA processing protein RimM